MNGYIFKAKRKDEDKWISFDIRTSYGSAMPDIELNSICQSIGMTDYDFNPIYENDVVMFRDRKAVVKFSDRDFRFELVFESDSKGKSYIPIHESHHSEIEVIGHIYEG